MTDERLASDTAGGQGDPHTSVPPAADIALGESEERWRRLFETMAEGVVLIDVDGSITSANPAAERILGLTRSEIEGRAYDAAEWDLVRPDGSPMPAEEMAGARAMREKRAVRDVVMGAVRPDGSVAWISVDASPVFDAAGELEGIVGTFTDITAQRQADEALRLSEERLAGALEGSEAALWDWRVQTAEVIFNERWAEIIGYTLAEISPVSIETWERFTHPDDQRRSRELLKRHLVGESPLYECEARMRHKDGHWVWVLDRGKVREWDDAGRPMRMIGTHLDITARKQAEQVLHASQERLHEAHRLAHIGTWNWVTETDTVTWSEELHRIAGRDPMLPAPAFAEHSAFCTPESWSRLQAAVEAALQMGESYELDLEFIRPDGTTRWAHCFGGRTVDADGRVEGLQGTVHDVTERKQAEEEIRRLNAELLGRVVSRTAQRDAFNRELETFAYSAAHDLRAPLRAIDGFSEILAEDAAERLTPDELGYLKRVRAAAQRMARMLDDLTGLSKVTRRPVDRRTVDVSALAGEVAEELRAAWPERRVDFVVAPGMTAAADPALLRVILAQLLDNAWKFTRGRAEARIEVGVRTGDGEIGVADEPVFFVRDDGAGFDMRRAQHLFGAFQRFHAGGEFEGEGIGLAIVQRLVLRHDGRVWAQAEVGEGATFFFTLGEAQPVRD
jgi:PAS domain S-box-containing protein